MQSFSLESCLPITLVCVVVSFLVCGIPFGLIIGKLSGNGDIRNAGSGNIGTTNALRVAGPKVAAATLLFDVLKGVLGVCVSRILIAHIAFGGQRRHARSRRSGRLGAGSRCPHLPVWTRFFSLPSFSRGQGYCRGCRCPLWMVLAPCTYSPWHLYRSRSDYKICLGWFHSNCGVGSRYGEHRIPLFLYSL